MIKPDYNKSLFGIFFLVLLIIIFLREPCLLIEGSLKNNVFGLYKTGISRSFLENLFHIYDGTGALMFWSNITNSIITLFPIDKAKLLANYFMASLYFVP